MNQQLIDTLIQDYIAAVIIGLLIIIKKVNNHDRSGRSSLNA
jgi:hypothetical protein